MAELLAWSGGNLVRASLGLKRQGVFGGRRGQIKSFSRQSAARLRRLIYSIRTDRLPYFLTLTFPSDVAADVAYNLFARWRKAVMREFEGVGVVWRVELTKRGRPHFHLLVYGLEFDSWADLVIVWMGVLERAGFDISHTFWVHKKGVRRVTDLRGLVFYLSKYFCKVGGGIENHRYWGYWGKIPWATLVRVVLHNADYFRLRRYIRRLTGWRPSYLGFSWYCRPTLALRLLGMSPGFAEALGS